LQLLDALVDLAPRQHAREAATQIGACGGVEARPLALREVERVEAAKRPRELLLLLVDDLLDVGNGHVDVCTRVGDDRVHLLLPRLPQLAQRALQRLAAAPHAEEPVLEPRLHLVEQVLSQPGERALDRLLPVAQAALALLGGVGLHLHLIKHLLLCTLKRLRQLDVEPPSALCDRSVDVLGNACQIDLLEFWELIFLDTTREAAQ